VGAMAPLTTPKSSPYYITHPYSKADHILLGGAGRENIIVGKAAQQLAG